MKLQLVPLGLLVLLGGWVDAPVSAQPIEHAELVDTREGERQNLISVYSGPGAVCGSTFMLVLNTDETLTRNDPRVDFLTYLIEREDGSILLYEGNYPQPSEAVIETGGEHPTLIAIHELGEDPAISAEETKQRIVTGNEFENACSERANLD